MSIVIERSFLNVHSKGCTLWLRRLFLKSLFVFLSFAWLKYKPPHFPMGKMNGSVKFCKYLSTLLLGKPFALELKPSKPSSLSSNSRTSRSLKRRRRSERNRFDSVSFDRLFLFRLLFAYCTSTARTPAYLCNEYGRSNSERVQPSTDGHSHPGSRPDSGSCRQSFDCLTLHENHPCPEKADPTHDLRRDPRRVQPQIVRKL